MLETVIAAWCLTHPVKPVNCEAQTLEWAEEMLEDGNTEEWIAEPLAAQTELFLRMGRVDEARLIVTATAQGTVHIYRDATDMEAEALPPHNLSCNTPCDIHIAPVGESGFGFYFESEGVRSDVMGPWSTQSAEVLDGIATYTAQVVSAEELHQIMSETLAAERESAIAAQCSDLSRPNLLNADAAPCVRFPGMMPKDATQSGHCDMIFDIMANGRTENVNAQICTDDIFRNASVESVEGYVFFPAKSDGQAVKTEGASNRVTFRLQDEMGRLIPE